MKRWNVHSFFCRSSAFFLALALLFGGFSPRPFALAEEDEEGADWPDPIPEEDVVFDYVITPDYLENPPAIGDKIILDITINRPEVLEGVNNTLVMVRWENPIYGTYDLPLTETYDGEIPTHIELPEILTAGKYDITVYFRKEAGLDEDGIMQHEIISWQAISFVVEGEEKVMPVLRAAAEKYKTDDEWETAKNLYDWVVNSLVYDHTFIRHGTDAILRGTGVCQSYAMIYTQVLQMAGLEAYYVEGLVDHLEVMNHGWTAVKIDGEYYYCDSTWEKSGDPERPKEQADEGGFPSGLVNYTYFCMNLKECVATGHQEPYHWYTAGQRSPVFPTQPSESLAGNYYVHTGLWKNWAIAKAAEGTTREPLLTDIRKTLEAGNAFWSSKGYELLDLDGKGDKRWVDPRIQRLLLNLLNGYKLTLSDGSEVELEAVSYYCFSQTRPVFNVYPKGKPAGDQPGVLKLPAGLTVVEEGAFRGLKQVGQVVCPEGLKRIGDYAFADASDDLGRITIPSSVEYIGEHAFENSDLQIKTDIPDSYVVRYAREHNIVCETNEDNG